MWLRLQADPNPWEFRPRIILNRLLSMPRSGAHVMPLRVAATHQLRLAGGALVSPSRTARGGVFVPFDRALRPMLVGPVDGVDLGAAQSWLAFIQEAARWSTR